MSKKVLVRMENIKKSFGGVKALRGINLEVRKAEILGLVGDNGAGKSTLMKILTGYIPKDEGKIYFDGSEVNFSSPSEARKRGIETVYQELGVIGELNVRRNFFLGRELEKGFFPFKYLDKSRMDKGLTQMLSDIGLKLRSPSEITAPFSGGEKQAICIGRALYFGAKLLILDEPVRNLSVKEQARVLDIIKKTREGGISSIFITHNVGHVYPVADRFVVLDRGYKVGSVDKKGVDMQDLTDMIIKGKSNG